jgi:hypothetical protein
LKSETEAAGSVNGRCGSPTPDARLVVGIAIA